MKLLMCLVLEEGRGWVNGSVNRLRVGWQQTRHPGRIGRSVELLAGFP